jgi:hypothetical protein
MPAPFAAQLCGYRPDKNKPGVRNPNTSDSSEDSSVELGKALFEELGVSEDQVAGNNPGAQLEAAIEASAHAAGPDHQAFPVGS